MGIELIHDDVNLGSVRVGVSDLLHCPSELRSLAVFRCVGPMAARLRRHDTEDVRRPTAAVLVVSVGNLAWRRGATLAHIVVELNRTLIECDNRVSLTWAPCQ